MGWTMGFQWMCFPTSQIEINIRFFVLLLKEMQHNSLKSKKKSMKIKEKFQIIIQFSIHERGHSLQRSNTLVFISIWELGKHIH